MKKYAIFLLISLLLAGCAAEETFETVADDWVQSVAAPMREVILILPEEAAAPVSAGEKGMLYRCGGYEIMVETLSSGDLEATVREVTGYSLENLTVLETREGDYKRYDLIWSCMGEQGQQGGLFVGHPVLEDGEKKLFQNISQLFSGCIPQFQQIFPGNRQIFQGHIGDAFPLGRAGVQAKGLSEQKKP